MWRKIGGWRFHCGCDWTVLEKEGQKDTGGNTSCDCVVQLHERSTQQMWIAGQRLDAGPGSSHWEKRCFNGNGDADGRWKLGGIHGR
eukprot:2764826-Prorocentrum_lima.AAC.1